MQIVVQMETCLLIPPVGDTTCGPSTIGQPPIGPGLVAALQPSPAYNIAGSYSIAGSCLPNLQPAMLVSSFNLEVWVGGFQTKRRDGALPW